MKATALLDLHHGPGFVLPNAWDAGTARVLAQAGFPAVASTSAGIAWSLGIPDGEKLERDVMLDRVAQIATAIDVPVSADLEAGYGDPADTVRRAIAAGAVGGNIEDAVDGVQLPIAEAIERIAAAREAAPTGSFVLNARTDTYFIGGSTDQFEETVERTRRFLEVGADCVFVPGVSDEDTISRLADAIPGPLNIVAGLAGSTPARRLFALGVRRVSLGGGLARAAYGLLDRAASELLATGTLDFMADAPSYADMQRRFG